MSFALSVTQAAPACSEHELVAAVRRGDDRAFEELYSRYRGRIGSYVFGMVGDHQRAEDIAQEVFISALRRLRDTERPIAFKPWIYEIAKNACIDEFRRTRRTREVPLQEDEDDAAPMPLVANGVDSAIENKQRLENLRGAFHGLSESHHKLIVMRELEGLSYDQIGERMGMTKPVVESQLFRARKRLGEEYDELVSGRRCEHVQSVIAADGERPLRTLGIRERRQFARHLSHCQPCRRHARMAGVDEQFFHVPGLAAKLAALFPFPFLRWRRGRNSSGGDEAAAAGSSHTIAALQSLPVVARLADPSSPMFGLSRAGAAVAALVIAGAGGGFVAGVEHGSSSRHATPAHSAPASGAIAAPAGRTIHVTPAVAGGGGNVPPRVRKPSSGRGGGGGGAAGHGGSGGSGGSASSGSQSSGGSRSSVGGALGSVGSTVQGVTSGGGSNSLGQVVSGASNTLNQASQGASNAANQVTQGASNAVNQVTQGASNAANQATQGASSAVNQATQGASSAVNQVTQGATNPVNQAAGGASNAASSAGNTLGNLTHP
jgi:RNA polymerase sigma factor (sigma-70 family)